MDELYLDRNLCLASNVGWEDADLVLLGVPFDSTVSNRTGAREGPYAIRRQFLELEKGDDFFESAFADLGNVEVAHGSPDETLARQAAIMDRLLKENPKAMPITLGGEHSCSYPAVEALFNHTPDLSVLVLDAHLDMRADYQGVELSHACISYRLARLGVPLPPGMEA